ncbi:MAG: LLM class flavin-dependent oxidoreductase [Armatimonadetes bacterium]|nr:LLM class flavin-dependent oxidoreductase [Armatimonadota bacterium]
MGEGRPLGLVLRDLLPPAGPREQLPARTLVEFAALAERLGYDGVWIPEGRGRELGTVLGALAAATDRIRLASGILPIYSRPPALVAMATATLADLTGGRFMLGLGVGHPSVIEDGFGMAYRQPLIAMREYVWIIRHILRGERVALRGRVFQVDDFQLESRPQHRVPIYVAGLGEKMLRIAGEIADGVILNWSGPERVRWAAGIVREAAQLAGRDPAAVSVVCFVRAAVTDEPEAAWRVMRRLLATYAAMPAYAQMFEAAGFAGEIAAMTSAWETGGVEAAAATASQEFVGQLAVVGSAQVCRQGLEQFREVGADLVAAYPFPFGYDPAGSMRETIEGLGST